jgi:pimeloyl-ACP methyl ester carboxylesterase
LRVQNSARKVFQESWSTSFKYRKLLVDKNRSGTHANRLMAGCLVAIFVACMVASNTQTDGGRVAIQDLRFTSSSGRVISALLYIPNRAAKDNPLPGVVALHGYINSRETQSGFAIEFARRGHVVLAVDQTGHGYSSPPAFADGFGGPDALNYLRSLPFVDRYRIGLSGHSMGGWASLMAASAYPDGYRSMVLEGSSTGTLGAPAGTSDFPRNLGLVFSQFDEFSELMWESITAPQITTSSKLQTLFGTDQPVIVGQLYGDIDKGTARKLYMPAVTHPGDHLSTEAIGNAIDWFQQTLGYDTNLSANDQTWYYKELGCLIALLFLVILIFPLTSYLLETPWFRVLKLPQPALPGDTPMQYWLSVALLAGIPVITYFKFQEWGNLLLPANSFWPQNITNGIMIWALGNGLITVALLSIKYRGYADIVPLLQGNENTTTLACIARSAALALVINLILYAVLALANVWFTLDFRFWVVALKLLSLDQAISFLAYLPFFTLFFVILCTALHRQLTWANGTTNSEPAGRAMFYNAIVLSIGFLILLTAQYVPLFMGRPMLLAEQPLLTIVAIQFVPLLTIVAASSTWMYRLTGRVYAGAFFNGIFVTWYIVAGQATHFAR